MITAAQSRAARGLLEWSQEEAATRAHLGLSTIRDFEKGRRQPTINNLAALQRAFEAAGVEFIPENGGGAGVRLAKRALQPRFRVEPMKAGAGAKVQVTWPDGHVEQVSGFATEAEAERWVAVDAAAWAAKHPRAGK